MPNKYPTLLWNSYIFAKTVCRTDKMVRINQGCSTSSSYLSSFFCINFKPCKPWYSLLNLFQNEFMKLYLNLKYLFIEEIFIMYLFVGRKPFIYCWTSYDSSIVSNKVSICVVVYIFCFLQIFILWNSWKSLLIWVTPIWFIRFWNIYTWKLLFLVFQFLPIVLASFVKSIWSWESPGILPQKPSFFSPNGTKPWNLALLDFSSFEYGRYLSV